MKEYYIIKLSPNKKFLIWYTDVIDGLLVEDNHLKSFNSLVETRDFCKKNKISLSEFEVSAVYKLSLLKKFIENPVDVDCEFILNFWNLFADIASSLNAEFVGNEKEYNKIYDKLFWGNNLPSVTPENKKYIPVFSKAELDSIVIIMDSGHNLLLSSI